MQTTLIHGGNIILREEKATFIASELVSHIGNNPDYVEVDILDGKSSISIDQIRKLIDMAFLKPKTGKYVVIWIKESQNLTVEAQNALLKILEEPPPYLLFILTVDHPENLIETVRSRCKLIKIEVTDVWVVNEEIDEDNYVSNFIELLSSDIGERLDWLNLNANDLKDRKKVVQVLNTWEVVYRDLVLISTQCEDAVINKDYIAELSNLVDDVSDSEGSNIDWKEKLYLLQKIKKAISNNNTSITLSLETLLVNL